MASDLLRCPARLAALEETGLLDAPPQESLDRYLRVTQASLRSAVVLISLVDDHRQFFSSTLGLGEPWASSRETPLSHSFCKHVVTSGRALVVADARHDPLLRDNGAVLDLAVVAYAGAPIRASEGFVLGSLCAIESAPRAWSARDLAVLHDLAGVVGDDLDLRRRAVSAVRAEKRLAEINRQLGDEQASTATRTNGVSHDLRTPLAVISLGVKHLASHDVVKAYPELERLVGTVQRNVGHAELLVGTMQAAVPLDTGAVTPIVDLAGLAREIGADLGMCRSSPSVDCSGVAREPIRVRCSYTSARRCVENLVSNALRFARFTVAIRVSRAGAKSVVEVEDDGAGLPDAEAYRHAWETHARFHVREGLSGSGLGLAIVREIVRRHGGDVEATRSWMGGARFALRFPSA